MPEDIAGNESQQAEQEWRERRERRELTCREKAAQGNVCKYQCTAKSRAARASERSGLLVEAYKCVACPYWHIGKKKYDG